MTNEHQRVINGTTRGLGGLNRCACCPRFRGGRGPAWAARFVDQKRGELPSPGCADRRGLSRGFCVGTTPVSGGKERVPAAGRLAGTLHSAAMFPVGGLRACLGERHRSGGGFGEHAPAGAGQSAAAGGG